MRRRNIGTSALLGVTGTLTAAGTIWFLKDVDPRNVSIAAGATAATVVFAQFVAGYTALGATPSVVLLNLGRWASLIAGSVVLGLVFSVVAVAGMVSFRAEVGVRSFALLIFAVLHLLASHAARAVAQLGAGADFGPQRW